MAGPDLTAARATVAALFDATCTVTHDVEGYGDDTFDETTLTYTKPPSDSSTVYSGACMVRPRGGQETEQGGAPIALVTHQARLPVTAVGITRGDLLTVTACDTDPAVLGTYTIVDVQAGSMAVSRILSLSRRETGVRT